MCMCTYITSFAVLMSKPLSWQCFILALLCLTFPFCGLQGIMKTPWTTFMTSAKSGPWKQPDRSWLIPGLLHSRCESVWFYHQGTDPNCRGAEKQVQKVSYSCCHRACKWHSVIVFCVLYLSVFYDYLLLLAANQIALPWIIAIPWTFEMQRILIPSGKLWITRHLRPLSLPTLSLIALQGGRPQTFRIKSSVRTIIFQPFTPENLQRFSSVDLLHKRHTSGAFSIWDVLHFLHSYLKYDARENNGRNNWVFSWS